MTERLAMKRPFIYHLFILLLVFTAGFMLKAANLPQSSGPLGEVGIEQKLNSQIPLDLEFSDETGKTVQLSTYFGKRPVILALVYYECPMLCTLSLNGLMETMKAMAFVPGNQYQVLAVSFNPTETPGLAASKKATYLTALNRPGGEEGWRFLTGSQQSITKLTQAVGFRYRWDAANSQFVHATGIIVLTPDGKISRYIYGIDFPERDLRLALVEASSKKIGSRTDQVLLYCYHYDPVSGRYSLAINRILQVAAVGTVICLGLLVWMMLRRERAGKGSKEGSGLAK